MSWTRHHKDQADLYGRMLEMEAGMEEKVTYDQVLHDNNERMKAKHPNLAELLEKARNYQMTPEEKREQRRSWVRGELMLEHLEMTREEADSRVRRAEKELGL